jgi:ribonuclease HI
MEAEYIALSETCKETMWLKAVRERFGYVDDDEVEINTDSQACISNINNRKYSNRTKHIDVKFYFVKDYYDEKIIALKFVSTETNVADLLTKPLGPTRIQNLNKLAGLEKIH